MKNLENRVSVVKVGTDTLTGVDGQLDHNVMVDIARQINEHMAATRERIILVSSGAVGSGKRKVDEQRVREAAALYGVDPKIVEKQVAAAHGQPDLIQAWKAAFGQGDTVRDVAQILASRYDIQDLSARRNLLATIQGTSLDAVPIVNENDSVATDELKYGDNDKLAMLLATLVHARSLVLLTNVNGLFTKDPNKFEDAEFIPEIASAEVTPKLLDGFQSKSTNGSGGMASKLDSARIASFYGVNAVIACGKESGALSRILTGDRSVGTWVI